MATTRRNVTSEDQKNEVLAKMKQYEDNTSILPSSWYITELTVDVEQKISEVVRRATE